MDNNILRFLGYARNDKGPRRWRGPIGLYAPFPNSQALMDSSSAPISRSSRYMCSVPVYKMSYLLSLLSRDWLSAHTNSKKSRMPLSRLNSING